MIFTQKQENISVCNLLATHVRPITSLFYKGHVSVISSNTPYKYNNARFKTVPLKPINDQLCGRYCRFLS